MELSGVMEILCTLTGGVDYVGIYISVSTHHGAHFRLGILLDVNASLKKKKQSQKLNAGAPCFGGFKTNTLTPFHSFHPQR